MSRTTKVIGYSAEQLSDAENLAEVMKKIPQKQRMLVTMSALAFISGMEVQAAMKEPEKTA